ncbi:MAG: biopolymer transporter ExbD [Pirellulales bacterium]
MQAASWNIGETGSEQLIARRSQHVDPEFDITAMVDLVFMMNIYFLVTFVLVAGAGVTLPSAVHCAALDAETAVIITIQRGPDGKSAAVYLADDTKGAPLRDLTEQEQGIQRLVEQGSKTGKTAVLLKAERNARLGDVYRIASTATAEGMSLHVAVLEKNEAE